MKLRISSAENSGWKQPRKQQGWPRRHFFLALCLFLSNSQVHAWWVVQASPSPPGCYQDRTAACNAFGARVGGDWFFSAPAGPSRCKNWDTRAYRYFSGCGCTSGQDLDGDGTCDDNQCPSPGGSGNTDCQADNKYSEDSCSVGNPIGLLTGIKTQVETDYRSSVFNGLVFSRSYSSSINPRQFADKVLGHGWTHNYNRKLVFTANDAVVYAIREDGRELYFRQDGSGGWVADSDVAQFGLAAIGSSWELSTPKAGAVETYDATGRLVSIRWPTLEVHTLSHELSVAQGGDGNTATLDRVTDQYGNQLAFSYNSTNYISAVTAPGGLTYSYAYDVHGNLSSVSYPGASGSLSYHYESTTNLSALTGITDENGDRYANWTYDSRGRATSSEHGASGSGIDRTTLDYSHVDDASPYIAVTNALDKATRYTFETHFGVKKITQIDGIASANCLADTASRGYNALGWLETETDRNGNVTRYVYYTDADRYGQVRSRTEAEATPQERRVELDWYPNRLLKQEVVVGFSRTDYAYNSENRLQSKTVTDLTTFSSPYASTGRTRGWSYSYSYHDPALKRQLATVSIDGPRAGSGDTTVYSYSLSGDLTRMSNALGHITHYADHNGWGQPETIVDPNNVQTRLTYTARGWLETVTVENGMNDAVTDYDYDAAGQLTSVTLANGVVLNYVYDSAHRLTEISDGDGNKVSYSLDSAGKILLEKTSTHQGLVTRSVERFFDELSRLRSVTSPEFSGRTTRYEYDANSNVSLIRLGTNTAVTRLHDALDRVQLINHADGGVSSYTYDDQGYPLTVKDQRNLVTRYRYDGLGNLMRLVSPDTGVTNYNSYDSAGNRLRMTDAKGRVTNYAYDDLNRVISVTFPADSSLNKFFGYDDTTRGSHQLGRLSWIQDGSGSQTYKYNALGYLLSRIVMVENQHYQWAYEYDLAGNLTGITYPSGRTVNYIRNSRGQISSLASHPWDGAASLVLMDDAQYLPFGPLNYFTYGNGIIQNLDYDQAYALEGISSQGSQTLFDWTLDYDPAGNIEAISDNLDSSRSQGFGYDDENRLDTANGPYGLLDYDYDLSGNRTLLDRDSGAETQSYALASGSHRLQSIAVNPAGTNITLAYDGTGNLVSDPRQGLSLGYNASNRLESVSGNAILVDYKHNALGQRVVKSGATPGLTHTHFHYDSQGRLVAETDNSGAAIREYVYADNLLLAVIEPNPASDTDSDGMDDEWELQHFGSLNQDGTLDSDRDGTSDLQEYREGGDPEVKDGLDTDDDGLADGWELQYWGDLSHGPGDDQDGDSLSNRIEYEMGSDPTQATFDPAQLLVSVMGLLL